VTGSSSNAGAPTSARRTVAEPFGCTATSRGARWSCDALSRNPCHADARRPPSPNREVDDVYLGNPLAQLVRDGLRTVHRLGAESPRRHERQQVVPSGDANHFLGCGERACGLEAETAQFENARAEAAKLHQLRSWCAGNDEEGHRQPRPRGVGRDCGAAVARGRPDKPGEARSSATATAAILSL
jgi:hypothetical protein